MCQSVRDRVTQTATVRIDFSVVGLTDAITATNISISSGLGNEVNNSIDQMDSIRTSVEGSTKDQINDAESNSNDTEASIRDLVTSISDMTNNLNLTSYTASITQLKNNETYKSYVVPGVKWGVVGLASIVLIVTFFFVLGLLGGIFLPQRKLTHKRCCDKTCASRCLTTGVSFTFIFFWLFTFLTMILFTIGGITHTEFCRHVVNVDKTEPDADSVKSLEVLFLFDSWISGMLPTGDFDLEPFHLYNSCIYNESVYNALHLETKFNLTSKINTDSIEDALTGIKNLNVTVPQVNITDAVLDNILHTLDTAFGTNGVNLPLLGEQTSGSVTSPDLLVLANDMDSLNIPALAPYFDGLRSYHQQNINGMVNLQNQLQQNLAASQAIIGSTSFGRAADNLATSQEVINTNGTKIVDDFISGDVDYISNLILSFVGGTVDSVENEVGRCRPLHDSLETILDALCVDLLYPVNGLWFSLGWCILFLLLGIFFAVSLASMMRYANNDNQVTNWDPVKG